MKILMVGAGATGGFYGGLLANAGRDVTFLLRERRAQQVRENGLEILMHTGENLRIHPRVITAEELRTLGPAFDLIVISTKAYQLQGAMDDIAPAVGPQTMLLPILNGMAQLALLDERFGAEHVLGGSVRVLSDLDEQGRVVQMGSLDQMSYGERSRERSARILAVDEAMRGAGFTAILQEDILEAMWQKWAILASVGTLCVLARGNVGQVNAVPHGPAFARALLKECVSIAAVNGYSQDETWFAQNLARVTEPGSTLTSSLYRDMVKGNAVEADHILGDLLARARDVQAPLVTAAYVQLKVYEASRPA